MRTVAHSIRYVSFRSEIHLTAGKPTPDRNTVAPPGRSARTEKAILEATRELLAEGGVQALTVEGVAARSGVGKASIYRRWRDRDELALAVMIDMLDHFRAPPDVGDTRKELLTFVESAIKIFASVGVIEGLASQIASDPELGRVYREQVVEVRRSEVATVIERGIERGDLRADTDVRLAHELLVGPAFYRLILSGPPLNKAFAAQVVDAVLAAFRPLDRR